MPVTIHEVTKLNSRSVRLRTSTLDGGRDCSLSISNLVGESGLSLDPDHDSAEVFVPYRELYYDPTFSTDVIGYWPLLDTYDIGPNELHGTLSGSPSFVAGKVSNAIILDGASQYMTIAHNAAFNNTALTIAFWVKPDTIGTEQVILAKGGTPSSGDAIHFQFSVGSTTQNKYTFMIKAANGAFVQVLGGTAIAGTWAHVVGVLSSSYMAIYHNGELQQIQKLPAAVVYNTTELTIGKRSGTTPAYFDGTIDEVGIWAKAISLHDIPALYNLGNGIGYGGEAPQVVSATAQDFETIRIVFNNAMRSNAALTTATNYVFAGPYTLTAESVTRINSTTVDVTVTEEMETDGEYTVEISNVMSTLGIVIDSLYDTAGFYGIGVTPQLVNTLFVDDTHFDIFFNEDMMNNAALVLATNYVVSGSGAPTVQSLVRIDARTVRAQCTTIGEDTYLLTVSNVEDIHGNIIDPAHNTANIERDVIGPYLNTAVFSSLESNSILGHATLANNLVGFWPLGIALSDVHVNKLGGYANSNNTEAWPGKHGTSASRFNGSNQTITVNDTAALQSANWTVSYWVYFPSMPSNYPAMVCKGTSSGGEGMKYRFCIDHLYERIYLYCMNSDRTSFVLYGNKQIKTSTWYHVVGSFDGSSLALYIDGVLQSKLAFVGTAFNTGNFYIGSRGYYGDLYINAAMQDVGVWSRALTDSEIKDLYQSGNGLSYYNTRAANSIELTFNEIIKDTPDIIDITNYDYLNADTVLSHPTLPTGLVAFYEMNGNLRDSHIGQKHGELKGYMEHYRGAYGHNKSSVYLYPQSSYEGRGFIPSDPDFISDSFSISFWINQYIIDSSWRCVLGKGANTTGYCFYKNTSNQMYFEIRNTAASYYSVTDSSACVRDIWRHYVGVYDRATMHLSLYRNGLSVGSAVFSGTPDFGYYPISLGTRFQSNTPPFTLHDTIGSDNNGFFISNLGFWNRALSAIEIKDLWNDGVGRNYNIGKFLSASKTDTDEITILQSPVERNR